MRGLSPAARGGMMRAQKRSMTLLISLLAATPVGGRASSLYLYGAGAASVGMAGADDAIATDYLAAWTNPANLALNQRVHFGIGGHAIAARFEIQQSGAHLQYPAALPQSAALGHIGVSSPIGGVFRNRVGLGIHMHIPMSGPTRLTARDHRVPQVAIYDSIENRLAVNMAIGGRLFPWLAVGAGFQLLASLNGDADFSMSVLDRRFTKRSLHIDLLSSVSPLLAVTVMPAAGTRLALTWRAEAAVRFALPVQVDVEQVGKLFFEVEGVGLWTPDQWVISASRQLGDWTLCAAATWSRWSKLPPMSPAIVLRLDDSAVATRGDHNRLISVKARSVQMGARDIVTSRIGAQWRLSDLVTVRAGARYRPTPLPKADGNANYLDAPAITVASGLSLTLYDRALQQRAPLRVDIGLAWTELQRRTVTKRDPEDPVIATSIAGGNARFALTLRHDF